MLLVITPQAICVKKSQFFRSLYRKTITPDAEGQNLFDVKGSEGLFSMKNNVSRCIAFGSMQTCQICPFCFHQQTQHSEGSQALTT